MRLTLSDITRQRSAWERADIRLPSYDVSAMRLRTLEAPAWIHFGPGNIFRAFLAAMQQRLLNMGLATTGILTVGGAASPAIARVYAPYDNLSLLVHMAADGAYEKEVVASVAAAYCGDAACSDWQALERAFCAPSLQVVTFTITEKGYEITGRDGGFSDRIRPDIVGGPAQARHTMAVACALLYRRYMAGGTPVAMVSMDNCAHNGDRLRTSVAAIAAAWYAGGFVEQGFLSWLEDTSCVSFPHTMIDKITPRPSEAVAQHLAACGVEGMSIFRADGKAPLAPFVNAEVTEYLVVEDVFPNGRPLWEKAGVYMTDRATVEKAEQMKVGACLNPLHTALAIGGCLLGYTSIAAEMADPDLRRLAEGIAAEGLSVTPDPGIFCPRTFAEQVLCQRLPNRAIPDTPQRIAEDTSQKVPIRFGGTLRRYGRQMPARTAHLTYIPWTIAAWCRYLLGLDDAGRPMPISPDPGAPRLQKLLEGVRLGEPESCGDRLRPILSDETLFGVDLYAVELGEKIEQTMEFMLQGPGAVRRSLQQTIGNTI